MAELERAEDLARHGPPSAEAAADGLTSVEAGNRLRAEGFNELPEKQRNAILEFLEHFWGPIPWMIEAAMVLSAMVRRWDDFFIIMALLILNAGIGFWEEFQAGNAIAALKAKLAPTARVRRDGAWTTLPAREIVRGDLVRLRMGDIVPADTQLCDGDPLDVDRSALTGESLPVRVGPNELVYAGSLIKKGEINGVVKATGRKTYFGKTAELVESVHMVSHFQKAVLKIGDYLIAVAGFLVVLILVVALFRGEHWGMILPFALVLTVAAIPVAMPTVLSVTMAVGARLLARRHAIISRLAAIEELAGMDVLCSDKTGTLTQNKLTLGEPFIVEGTDPHELVLAAALASRAEDQDPIDQAVLRGLSNAAELSPYEVFHFQPFDPVIKRTEAWVRPLHGSSFKTSKGAPQVMVKLAGVDDRVRTQVERAVDACSARGFRSLVVARSNEMDGSWRILGVLPLFDPPREDAKSTINLAKEMGIQVKMVTGDQVAIGREMARQVGLGTNILDAGIFEGTRPHESGQLEDAIARADGFAQVFPEHKFLIIEAFQKRRHIAGMTGDGVNDAPALKKADVGIAVSGATDAARAAADIVLLTPGLSIIIEAVQESRRIFQRMTSYAIYRICETIRVLLFMTLSILVFNFYPVTAIMIVLLALLNDGAILSIAYDRAQYSHKPEAWNMREVLGVSTALGLIGVVASFGLFYLGERVFQLPRDTIQTLIYLKLSVAGHFTVFVARTRGPFWSTRPAPILILAVLCTQIIATMIAVSGWFMSPVSWEWALFVWVYALAWVLINDRIKLAAYRMLHPHQSMLMRKSLS